MVEQAKVLISELPNETADDLDAAVFPVSRAGMTRKASGPVLSDYVLSQIAEKPSATEGVARLVAIDGDGAVVLAHSNEQNVLNLGVSLVDAIPDIRDALLKGIDEGYAVYIPPGQFRISSFVGRTLTGETNVTIRGAGRATKIICEGDYGFFFNTADCEENHGGVTIRDLDLLASDAGVTDWAIKVISGPRTKQDEGKFKVFIDNVICAGVDDASYFAKGIIGDGGPGIISNCTIRGMTDDYRLCSVGIEIVVGVEWILRAPQVFFCKDAVLIGQNLSSTSVEGTVISDGHLVICDRGIVIQTGTPGDLHILANNHMNALQKGIYVEDASTDKVSWVHARANTILRQIPRTYGDGLFEEDYGTARAGTSTTLQLATTALADEDNYVGRMIVITAGTGSGQERRITAYNEGTKTATVDSAWAITPDNTTVYYIEHIFSGIEGVFKEGTIVGNVVARNNGSYHYGIRLLTGSLDTIVDGNITQNTNALDIIIDDNDASGISIGLNHSSAGSVKQGIGAITVAGADTGVQFVSQAGSVILRALTSAVSGNSNMLIRSAGTGDHIFQGGDILSRFVIKGTVGAAYPEFESAASGFVVTAKSSGSNADAILTGKGTYGGKMVAGDGNIKIQWNTTGVGLNGVSPVGKQTLSAALSTGGSETNANICTAINAIRTALINSGVGQ